MWRCIAPRSVEAGEVVIREGDPGEALYVIQEGRVKVEKRAGDKTVTLTELGPGTAFGEMSLLEPSPTSATVTAMENGELWHILAVGLPADFAPSNTPVLHPIEDQETGPEIAQRARAVVATVARAMPRVSRLSG